MQEVQFYFDTLHLYGMHSIVRYRVAVSVGYSFCHFNDRTFYLNRSCKNNVLDYFDAVENLVQNIKKY
jgi:hypothetical protein